MQRGIALWLTIAVCLTACEQKPAAPSWTRVSKEQACPKAVQGEGASPSACGGTVFFLDTANVRKQAGVLYVTLQTRADEGTPGGAAGAYGIIHAEANCALKKLEPTGLHEDRYGSDGRMIESRLAVISAEDEDSVLAYACAKFGQ